ncbi:MAG TPA: MBL fold metallo-hydrolase [Gammaproteobacteria bacterium]|jgi:glyoxylase-like metal-dependent hydrolase (beta-lactamase superfamily II)
MRRAFRAWPIAFAASLVALTAGAQESRIESHHVQGNVYLLTGAASNIAVQIGDDGILIVDTGGPETSDEVLAAIRELSDKPIRWIVNTHEHIDHTGANAVLSAAGITVNGNPAAIVSHENVLTRMALADRPVPEWPLNTFFESQRDFYFNGEAVFLYHVPSAHTDGDIMVYFRGSDVLVTGDLFVTTHFPLIDLDYAGGVNGYLEGLNAALEITVPAFLQEGGTYVIPGHGRIGDEADVVSYRDLVLFVRDRVQSMIDEGMSLRQVQAAEPALDYGARYHDERIPLTTEQFVESVYRSLED